MRFIYTLLTLPLFLVACTDHSDSSNGVESTKIEFVVIDTDFSKGRLQHVQQINLSDLEKFHGHLCDGLIVGALGIKEGLKILYPNDTIDRTNLRVISKSSPCLTDVAIYVGGGRYQFETFYVDNNIPGFYVIQRIDNLKTISISIKEGVIPHEIDSLGALAVQQKLEACQIDYLKNLEDELSKKLLSTSPDQLFIIQEVHSDVWKPSFTTFPKTDVLNKAKEECIKK